MSDIDSTLTSSWTTDLMVSLQGIMSLSTEVCMLFSSCVVMVSLLVSFFQIQWSLGDGISCPPPPPSFSIDLDLEMFESLLDRCLMFLAFYQALFMATNAHITLLSCDSSNSFLLITF